jgi:hypothetical protein
MKDIQEEPAYSTSVIEMLKVANEYCIYLENTENLSRNEIMPFIQRIVPLLYLKGSLLPNVEVDDIEASERFVTGEQWEGVFNFIRKQFAELDEYWFLNYNSPDQTDPVKASISENLADIYQDLKDFVMLYQKPARASKQNAVRDCKHLFETHWAAKALQLIQWIHYLNYKEINNESYSYLF